MKTRKTKEEAAAPSPKGKVKIKNLKLARETIENLSDRDAADVKGGSQSADLNSRRACGTLGC